MRTSIPGSCLAGLTAMALAVGACVPTVDGAGVGTAQLPTAPDDGGDAPACGDVELHVVGLYDPYATANDALGPAHVHVDRPGTMILFLSAYTATDWTVTVGPDTQLLRVIAHGYEPQSLQVPPDVEAATVSAATGDAFLGCGYEFPDRDPTSGCETPELLAGVEAFVGLPVSSFHGCYAASEFTLRADLSSSSDCATDMGYAHTSMVSDACGGAPPDGSGGPCDGEGCDGSGGGCGG